jgi:sulfite reductase (NADPH) hemoprotein beta-component
MADLADARLHGMQTSGNCVRNITTDQWAGVAPDEIEDPRIWAELLRQHLTLHPEFSFLPRKFKIAVGAAQHDRAALAIHDLSVRLYRNGAGETGFEIGVGGGLGRTPFLTKIVKPFLAKRDLLSYVEAVLRLYNQYGRRDNIYKARIKILVHELGAERFGKEVEAEWQAIKDGTLALDPVVIADIAARFRYPDYERLADNPPELAAARKSDARFATWLDNSVSNHKVPGYAIVTLSLKPIGKTPGDCTAEQMDAIADLADRYSFSEIRVGHEHLGHYRLPGSRLLQPRQCEGHSGCAGDLQALCRPRRRARSWPTAHQHFRLHQCVRPSSRRPHRDSRCREERRGVLSDHHRRPRRRAGAAWNPCRSGGPLRRRRRCG